MKQQDSQLYAMGIYALSAVSVAIEHNFAKKAKSEYIKKPLLQEIEKENAENTNKESQEEVAIFEMRQRINLLRKSGLPESPI